MIVEHQFITTLPPDDYTMLATAFLRDIGFTAHSDEHHSVIGRRGKSGATYAKSADQLPQNVRLSYDRGRVNVAVSVETAKLKLKNTQPYALAIATGLERILAHLEPMDESVMTARQAANALSEDFRSRKQFRLGLVLAVVGVIVLLLFGCIIFAIAMS